jgi:hypothetical protein
MFVDIHATSTDIVDGVIVDRYHTMQDVVGRIQADQDHNKNQLWSRLGLTRNLCCKPIAKCRRRFQLHQLCCQLISKRRRRLLKNSRRLR